MKKIILGCASAILSGIGLTSFTNHNKGLISYYWFLVPCGVSVGVTKPTFAQIGGDIAYKGFETLQSLEQTNLFVCSGSGDLCIVGYTLGAIKGFRAGIPTSLKTVSGIPVGYKTKGGLSQSCQQVLGKFVAIFKLFL